MDDAGRAQADRVVSSMRDRLESLADSEVILNILSGDVNAFEVLIDRYKGYVFKIVSKHVPYDEVEEVAHDAFIRAYQTLPSYKDRSDFRHWLSTIATRTCYDFWRARHRRPEMPLSELSDAQQKWLETAVTEEAADSLENMASRVEAREILELALDRLSAEEQMVIQTVYLDGLSIKEAASIRWTWWSSRSRN